MKSHSDQDLLGFLLGELTLRQRLDVRVRLAFSASARRRLTELERVAGGIAGAIGVGGAAGFSANRRVKLRRLLFLDLAAAAILLSTIGAGATLAWHSLRPGPENCATGPVAYPVAGARPSNSDTPHRFPKNVQPAK